MRLARLHFTIKNRRRDFLHKLTTRLAKTKSVIVIEDLNVSGLRNGRHSRSISDAGWAEFRRMLEYKCQWYGCRLVVTPRDFASSKTCFPCGARNAALALSDRAWTCPSCGAVLDRDLNAARNLVAWYETNSTTGSSPGSHASGDSASTPPVVVARAGSSKEEANAIKDVS
jgi:putative transposase